MSTIALTKALISILKEDPGSLLDLQASADLISPALRGTGLNQLVLRAANDDLTAAFQIYEFMCQSTSRDLCMYLKQARPGFECGVSDGKSSWSAISRTYSNSPAVALLMTSLYIWIDIQRELAKKEDSGES